MSKMSITQALSELKLLDSRISKEVTAGSFCEAYMANTKIKGRLTPQEAEDQIKSNYQSVNDLIRRRANIKSAIVSSNATTSVEIDGVKMSVAEAIERKSSIKYQQSLLTRMTHDYQKALAAVTQGNEKAQAKAQDSLDAVLGKEGGKTPTKDDIAAIYDPVYQRYEYKFLDPLNIQKEIEKLEQEITGFLSNVDFVLSTSNALTTIEVD